LDPKAVVLQVFGDVGLQGSQVCALALKVSTFSPIMTTSYVMVTGSLTWLGENFVTNLTQCTG